MPTEWQGRADFGEPLDTPAQYFIKYFTPALLQNFQRKQISTLAEQLDKAYELHLKKYKSFLAYQINGKFEVSETTNVLAPCNKS